MRTSARQWQHRIGSPRPARRHHCEQIGNAPAGRLPRNGLLQCAACERQTSVIAGTIFPESRTPLPQWFRAMWYLASQKSGARAFGLQHGLGLGSYETAWTWLHKLRRAMVRPGRDRLAGRVEVDETYLGAEEAGIRGRGSLTKNLIAVAVDMPPGASVASGGVTFRTHRPTICEASSTRSSSLAASCTPLAWVRPAEGAWVSTPDHVPHRSSRTGARTVPRVHLLVSLLKRWLLGTHQGAIRPAHLNFYLDEFTFRFNRRRSRHRGKLFFRLAERRLCRSSQLPTER
jgi:hypothetical protein